MNLLFIFSIIFYSIFNVHVANPFQYGAKIKEWPKDCEGNNQSPIEIITSKVIPLSIPALEMVGFQNLLPRSITVSNSGHSVELSSIPVGYAKIFGALLDGEYDVIGIHFHWGRGYSKGSEHKINSVSFPMEMHIVTRNSKYSTTSQAISHENGLAVMAFFFSFREKANTFLKFLLNELEMVKQEGSTVYMDNSFTLASLISTDTNFFYTYRGSLTTPPCSEAVTWIIFPDPMPVSYSQMKQFRSLKNGRNKLVDNFRPLQKLNERRVFVKRHPTDVFPQGHVMYNVSSPLFWGTFNYDDIETFNELK